jgi:hypothetical protein
MSRYREHALEEFRAAGWTDENGKFEDEWQEEICNHILDLLDTFAKGDHSGTSAPYTVRLFEKLALFQPIAKLTGEDWEWVDVGEQNGGPLWQNKRCSRVFKDLNGAYDIEGIIFYDVFLDDDGKERKSYYTCGDSHVRITFPYTPTSEHVPRQHAESDNE